MAQVGTNRCLSALIGVSRREEISKNEAVFDFVHENQIIETQKHIPKMVERGFAIHQQLSLLNEEFKQIKERLKGEAEIYSHEHLPLLDKESEGKQWGAQAKGCECRIVFPDPKTTPQFDTGESDFLIIRSGSVRTFIWRRRFWEEVSWLIVVLEEKISVGF